MVGSDKHRVPIVAWASRGDGALVVKGVWRKKGKLPGYGVVDVTTSRLLVIDICEYRTKIHMNNFNISRETFLDTDIAVM